MQETPITSFPNQNASEYASDCDNAVSFVIFINISFHASLYVEVEIEYIKSVKG